MQAVAINQKFRNFLEQLKQQVINFAKEIRTDDQRQFWEESDTMEVLGETDKRISKIDRTYLGFAEKVSPKFMPLLTKNFLTNQ